MLPHQSMSLTSAAYLLIWINLAGWFKPRWDFGRWDRHSRQVRDDGPRSDDQSLAEFGSRKILGRYTDAKHVHDSMIHIICFFLSMDAAR